MQAGKNIASSAKEKVANTGDSAKAGRGKTEAIVQGQMEKMTTHDPVEKEMAQKKDDKIQEAEINKQEARAEHAVLKEQSRVACGVAGQPTGAGVTSGMVGAHPIGVNTGTGTGTGTGNTTAHNTLTGGTNPGVHGTGGGCT